MIPVRRSDGTRNPIVFNGLTFNTSTPAAPLDTIELNTVTTVGQFDTVQDTHPSDDGTEVTTVRRTGYVLRLDGVVRGSTLAAHYDLKKALAKAFDPALASQVTSVATAGVLPMDFDVPTLDTTNYASGYVPSRYYVRARAGVVPPDSDFTGTAAFWTAEILVPDPRRYWQTLSLPQSVTSGSVTSPLAIVNLGDYPSWPVYSISMSGAGSATFTITYSATPLVLNFTGLANNDVIVVDCAARTITKNGVDAISRYVSGTFQQLVPGTVNLSLTNTTGVFTFVTQYRRAFVV